MSAHVTSLRPLPDPDQARPTILDTGLPAWPLDDLHRIEPDFDALAFGAVAERRLLIGRLDGARCFVLSEHCGPATWAWLQGRWNEATRIGVVSAADFDALLSRFGASLRALDGAMPDAPGAFDADAAIEEISLAGLAHEGNVVVRMLGATLFDAFRSGASDIHFEGQLGGAQIKYRLDGVLASAGFIDGAQTFEQVISRIKVLAQLDVGERRLPQDGRFRSRMEGRDVDFRVSIIPGTHGEDAVLRILDRRNLTDQHDSLDLERLGYREPMLAELRGLAARPHGMLLVTGPTGSGKTTTLYAALSEVNDGRHKIITIEDPVEYQLRGVLQVPVNEKTGLTFARGLRSILRHDPDTILIGEIRDQETAQIAVQAALTGHLVLSSIHANTVFDVLARFMHMNVDPYNLVSALNGIVAQRLVRLNCPRCAHDEPVPQAVRDRVPALANAGHARRGRGCGDCRGTGYRGRVAIAELVRADDTLREGILKRESPRRLREQAVANGMKSLSAHAAELVVAGRTSIEELLRVSEME